MRVAFVSYQWGEYSLRLTGALAGHATVQLSLAADQAAPHLRFLDERVDVLAFDKPRLRQPVRQLAQLRRLVDRIHEFEPDVVHLQHGHLWFNSILHRLRRYPLVVTIHDPRHHLGDRSSQRTPQRVLDYGFRRATRVIVHTDTMADEVSAHIGIPRRDLDVVPHLQLGDDADGADIAEEDGMVLFFGRMWPYKGLDQLISAEPLITAAVPNARFVIAGTGGDLTRYRQQMVHPERFTVRDEYVSATERAELFRRASVIALPYLEATQSGIVPLAATYGTPVVATRVGGLPDQIDDGRTGLLVPPRDAAALADAIIRLLNDSGLRRELGEGARTKAHREWSADSIAARTMAVYEAAVATFSGRAIGRVG